MNCRKINRKILSFLPEKVRLFFNRRNIVLDHAWPSESLEIKIADTEEELEAAYRLLHDSYVKAGFMNPDVTGLRVLAQHLLPQTTTIVAKWDGQIIGTVTLIRDNSFGLPLEKIFDVNGRRGGGRRLAEVSSLAVHPDYRKQVNRSLFPIFRFVFQYSKYYFGVSELVIAVNPSMVDLYLSVLCFEKLKIKQKPYDFVKGAPAVGLFLDLETAEQRMKKVFDHKKLQFNFYKYWTNRTAQSGFKLPVRQYHSVSDPILSVNLLSKLYLEKARLAEKITAKEIQILLDNYPYPAYQKILQPLYERLERQNVRLETHMIGKSEQDEGEFSVLNVSKNGLLIRGHDLALVKGQQLYIRVQISDAITTRLKVQINRGPQNSLFGLKILENNLQWQKMIDTLENDYRKNTVLGLRSAA